MTVTFRKLHPVFAAEVDAPDLREIVDQEVFEEILKGLDEYAVLVFPDQPFNDDEQTEFTRRLNQAIVKKSKLYRHTGSNSVDKATLSQLEASLVLDLIKVSNVDDTNRIVDANDRQRVSKLGNRIWHTDGSSLSPSGTYTMLSGRIIPPVRADTEFADTRAAYDALDDESKIKLSGLSVYHSLVYSRGLLGFQFSKEEEEQLKGAVHPLVRTIPRSQRKSLYLGAHAARVVEMPIPEGRLLLRDLTEHATQELFVYRHAWRKNDFVMWDNRATLHRARPFDDAKYKRDMRRTMIRDIAEAEAVV